MDVLLFAIFICGLVFPFLYFSKWKESRNIKKEIELFRQNSITDSELEKKRSQLENELHELKLAQDRLAPLEAKEESIIAVGAVVFEYDDSDKYKDALIEIKGMQKSIVKEKLHIEGPILTFEGDKKFHSKLVKLVLLAYNAAADDARHSVKWNNFDRVVTRFDKQRETINSLTPIQITRAFHEIKVREITLTFHREELRQKEREERKEMQAQMREEARAEREIEQARKQAERDAQIASKAVVDAEARLKSATEQERSGLEAQLKLLQIQLDDATTANTRALSMAQQTKRGHVYVISNIGSFGEDVYKVGMTRRLIPEERVKDLGDASVPFSFDIHAMIETDDAPGLESDLHKLLNEKRVNRINMRKEFFYAPLGEIKEYVRQFSPEAEFVDMAEAREFRETESLSRLERPLLHATVQ